MRRPQTLHSKDFDETRAEKGSFFYIKKVIPSSFPKLLLEDNKFDKKSFKDKIPLLPQTDPLYDQISTYPFNIQTSSNPILYLAGLKTSWKYSPKKPVIYHRGQGVNGEFNFLLEGGLDKNRSSTRSVNNEAPMINVEPTCIVHPLNDAGNILDSHNISSDEGRLSPIGPNAPSYPEEGKISTVTGKRKVAGKRKVVVGSHGEDLHQKDRKVPAQASKVAGDASSPLNVDSDPDIHEFPSAKELKDVTDYHWIIANVTPPSWKQYLRDISIEQLCDIHDKAYIHQAVLDNILNGRTRELVFALHKARASCDIMREREIKKNKAYAELEKKCNEALQDLDENPLVSDMRYEIETLQIKGLESEGKRLEAFEIKLLEEACQGIYHYGRCTTFEEVADLKKPFVLEEMTGYRLSSKEEYDRAGNDLADASYPFLAELTVDPYASVENLLSKKP
nr:hypothetical protein [Tanacetum cinerariifolium]